MPSNHSSYALANPLMALVDKSREEFQRADFLKIIEQEQIERITFHYTALDGKLKELKLPFSNRREAESILTEGERIDGSSLFKGIMDADLSDLYIIPEYKTAFLNPFKERSLDFICRYFTQDGKQAPFALDTILARANKLFCKTTGIELYALGELEFFLIGEKRPIMYPLQNQQGYHEAAPFTKSEEILDEMVRCIAQVTGAVKYIHSEVGVIESIQSPSKEINGKRAEQHEVEFLSRPVQEMADALVISRWIIRNVAYRHGCLATFTPKLEEGVAGNGFHFHLELKKNGKNIMLDANRRLSNFAIRLIGGLCEYADSLTAFGNTVSSSYFRLVPDQEAPTKIYWSDFNRNAMIRIPLGWAKEQNLASLVNPQEKSEAKNSESRQTIEFRTPDGSAIIHLLLAGITMAAEWGIKNKQSQELAAKLYMKGDMIGDSKILNAFAPLPSNCVESGQILLKKRDLYERKKIFPPSVVEYVASLLKLENDGDLNNKLASLKGKDRIREIHKIMHKDLHRH